MKIKHVTAKENFVPWLANSWEYDLSGSSEYIDSEYIVEITEAQADDIEAVAERMYEMCLEAVDKVIREERFEEFGISPLQAEFIKKSWDRREQTGGAIDRDPELAGRFDFCWDGVNPPKFYEFNADCYTTLYEASVIQWAVANDLIERGEIPEDASQFNSIEEKMAERFAHIRELAKDQISDTLHLTCYTDYEEDLTTTNYMKHLAELGGWKTHFVDIGLIGANEAKESPDYAKLFDEKDNEIKILYKLMPWEHLFENNYAEYIAEDKTLFLEPAWRAILSNKMLSVVLWEMYPGHENLIPTYTSPENLGDNYIEKPIFGRIGSGMRVIKDGKVVAQKGANSEDTMDYSEYRKIFQELCPLPELDGLPGWKIQTGIWMVGDGEVAGMDLRRDTSLINGSKNVRFLPHYMKPHI